MTDTLHALIDEQVERLGFELVDLERAGSRARPILRLRIDRPDAEPGHGVDLGDCTAVSRALEAILDERPDLGPRYTLEVSSPGVERPLMRTRDFERFAGQEIAVHSAVPIAGTSKRVEGTLIGMKIDETGEHVLLRTRAGEDLVIPRRQTTKIHLVYRWGGRGRRD